MLAPTGLKYTVADVRTRSLQLGFRKTPRRDVMICVTVGLSLSQLRSGVKRIRPSTTDLITTPSDRMSQGCRKEFIVYSGCCPCFGYLKLSVKYNPLPAIRQRDICPLEALLILETGFKDECKGGEAWRCSKVNPQYDNSIT